MDGEVGEGFVNSLKMAAGTAFFGTALALGESSVLARLWGDKVEIAAMAPRTASWKLV